MAATELKKRLEKIAREFAGRVELGFTDAAALENLFVSELGSLDISSEGIRSGGSRVKARFPERIYHVLASNLAISGETSLLLGLMLGSELIFKLPGAGLPEFEAMVERLPAEFKARIKLVRTLDEAEMRDCDAVVVYGSDETVEFFRTRLRPAQRTLFYGHRISFGILEKGLGDLQSWAGRAADEVEAYDQRGCLSPQFYWAETEKEAREFTEYLAGALGKNVEGESFGALSFEETSQRRHARRVLRGRGAKVLESDAGKGFTIALLPDANFFVGPGNRFVLVGFGGDPGIELQAWKGTVSSISVASPVWPPARDRWERLAMDLRASRLCRMGDLQKPPLSWRHDGRPRLSDLVTWMTLDV